MELGAALLVLGVLGFAQLLPNAPIIAVMTLLIGHRLFVKLDRRPVILEFSAAIACLQFLIAPLFVYSGFDTGLRYQMYVPEAEYYRYAIPAVCGFVLGLTLRTPWGREFPQVVKGERSHPTAGMTLIGLGLSATVLARYAPGQLGFFFYILSQLRYIGAIYFYTSDRPYKWLVIGVVLSGLLATASQYGMFHELLLWTVLLGSHFFALRPRSVWEKLSFLAGVCVLVAIVQLIKVEYRDGIRRGDASLLGTTLEKLSEKDAFGQSWQQSMVIRMNQGWIVSKAMQYVPSNTAYARGSTIKEAVIAAVLPRILSPYKKSASGTANVNRFTGLEVSRSTSMGLSPLGEGYINFGVFGGCAVMFCFGLLLNQIYRLLALYSYRNRFFLYCMPLVFLQAIKMETEFLTIFNHLTKSLLVVFCIYHFWVSRSLFFRAITKQRRLQPSRSG